MIRCTVGVLAHNEAHNIQRALQALLAQQMWDAVVAEIIVIASGCTDSTVELAQGVARAHPIVRVVVETERTGKAAAITRLISMAQGDVIVLVGADTLPEPAAIHHLVRPFADPRVGMTGARVIPLNAPTTWLGFTVQMLWHVHHHLALRKPKLGELVAFRNVIDNFPEDTSTDEPALEALIAAKRLRLMYTPQAVVYNRGPEETKEFLVQRRRIFAGQMRVLLRYGYLTSSLRLRHVLPLAVEAIGSYPRFFLWTFAAMAVECWARLLGLYDALRGREDVVWRAAQTTKAVATPFEPLTLLSVKWHPGSLNSMAFLRDVRRHAEPDGSVFWWDGNQGEILLFVGADESPLEWLQDRIKGVTGEHVRSRANAPRVSCRLVKFSPPALN